MKLADVVSRVPHANPFTTVLSVMSVVFLFGFARVKRHLARKYDSQQVRLTSPSGEDRVDDDDVDGDDGHDMNATSSLMHHGEPSRTMGTGDRSRSSEIPLHVRLVFFGMNLVASMAEVNRLYFCRAYT